jgi:protein-L-isoaspartate(D-aspartate) O-methyltransferase
LIDTFKHKGLRKRLCLELSDKGIKSNQVLNALNEIPRHFFFEKSFEDKAYLDQAFPIDDNQTISQPYTVAFQTQLLDIQVGDKVLEIGTGSGYQAAILHKLGAEVHTIERHESLYRKAIALFKSLDMKINCYWGDGSLGLQQKAPFDKIIVTAAAPEWASSLQSQLRLGGKLVLPLGNKTVQKMVLIVRQDENNYSREQFGDFKFVPLLGKNGWKT